MARKGTSRRGDAPFDGDRAATANFIKVFWGDRPILKQVRFVLGSRARNQLFCGGIASGKTWSLLAKGIYLGMCNPDVPGIIGGRTGRDIRQTLMPQFLEHCARWADATGYHLIADHSIGEQVIRWWNGAQFYFRSYLEPDKLRGINAGWALLDELEYGRNANYTLDVIAGRLRHARRQVCQLAVATTPKGMQGVVGRWVANHGHPSWYAIHATIDDNPYLDAEFKDALRQCYSRRMARQELDGEILRPSDVVFAEYEESRHLTDWRWRTDLPWVIGVDWGTSAAAAVAVQVLPDGTWVVADELIGEDVSYTRWRRMLSDFVAEKGALPLFAASDRAVTSEKRWLHQRYSPAGVVVRSCMDQEQQSVARGAEMIRFMLDPLAGSPRLLLARSLRSAPAQPTGPLGIRDAMHAWCYKRGPDGHLSNQPNDAHDDPAKHVIDALRYALVMTSKEEVLHGGSYCPFILAEEYKDSGRLAE